MKYSKTDFEDMLGSLGTYVSPNKYSPDGDVLFGSMEDYFNKMSSGNVVINASLVNQLDEDFGRPVWLTLPHAKSYYQGFDYGNSPFINDAISTAQSAGLDVSTSSDTKIVVIYAGNTYTNSKGLNPLQSGNAYIMSEVQGRPYNQENAGDKFSRIGFHCHEFAHILGIGHSNGSRADLMSGAGVRNGSVEGNAPAPLDPAMRALKGWITPTLISTSQQRDIYYSLISPQVFRINSNYNDDYFIIENRRFNQTMVIGSTTVPDYNNSAFFPPAWSHGTISEGIFVWRIIGGYPSDYSNNGLVYASGRFGATFPENTPSETDDGVPFPGVAGIKVFSPWSDPRDPYSIGVFVPNSKSGTNVGIEILDENATTGYFTVDLFASNPQDASPSKPKDVRITNTTYTPIQVTWDSNLEPDLVSYEVWRQELIEPRPWQLIATTSSTSYADNDYIWLPGGNADLEYKVRAKDSQAKLSVFSEIAASDGEPMFERKPYDLLNLTSPVAFDLVQNYPNPFNPSTEIRYQLKAPSKVTLKVSDMLGRVVETVVDADLGAGFYNARFDGSRLASGLYFARITIIPQNQTAENKPFTHTIKMLLAK